MWIKSLIVLCMLCLPYSAFAVGNCTQSVNDFPTVTNPTTRTLTFVCTALAAEATYPATPVTSPNMNKLKGWMLMTGSAVNGSTGPKALSVITLSTPTEGDILGGAGKTATAATAALASKFTPLTDTGYATSGLVPITDSLTLAVTGNDVNAASLIIVFKFVK